MRVRFWKEKVLRCSFCNKSHRDVRKLIAGPKVYICDGCVELCNTIIAKDKASENVVASSPPVQEAIRPPERSP